VHVIIKQGLTGDSLSRTPGAFLLRVYQHYALGSGHPANRLVEMRIGAEPERVQVAGEEEIGGSSICLTERQLANGLPKSQLGEFRVNLAGLSVGGLGLSELTRILGASSMLKAFMPFLDLPGA
jgi:hypothetical protein